GGIKWWLKYVQPTLAKQLKSGALKPSVITVWLGSNDASLTNGSNPDMHVPLADYSKNLHEIVASFQAAAPSAEIVMITPPHAAAKAGVPVLDLYTHFNNMTVAKRDTYLHDGLHFSKAGHVIVNDLLRALIQKNFPDVNKQIDVWQYPFVAKWREEDPYTGSNSTAN
ncbi:hypothetical protein PHPALM_30215, partial [Phytophthora palmivora]